MQRLELEMRRRELARIAEQAAALNRRNRPNPYRKIEGVGGGGSILDADRVAKRDAGPLIGIRRAPEMGISESGQVVVLGDDAAAHVPGGAAPAAQDAGQGVLPLSRKQQREAERERKAESKLPLSELRKQREEEARRRREESDPVIMRRRAQEGDEAVRMESEAGQASQAQDWVRSRAEQYQSEGMDPAAAAERVRNDITADAQMSGAEKLRRRAAVDSWQGRETGMARETEDAAVRDEARTDRGIARSEAQRRLDRAKYEDTKQAAHDSVDTTALPPPVSADGAPVNITRWKQDALATAMQGVDPSDPEFAAKRAGVAARIDREASKLAETQAYDMEVKAKQEARATATSEREEQQVGRAFEIVRQSIHSAHQSPPKDPSMRAEHDRITNSMGRIMEQVNNGERTAASALPELMKLAVDSEAVLAKDAFKARGQPIPTAELQSVMDSLSKGEQPSADAMRKLLEASSPEALESVARMMKLLETTIGARLTAGKMPKATLPKATLPEQQEFDDLRVRLQGEVDRSGFFESKSATKAVIAAIDESAKLRGTTDKKSQARIAQLKRFIEVSQQAESARPDELPFLKSNWPKEYRDLLAEFNKLRDELDL
jgi:hypothetical protein